MPSTLRAALRSRLTTAMRERDRDTASVLRSAVAALENAEAVPVAEAPPGVTSEKVAGTALGVGATEAERRRLDPTTERAIVGSEVASLVEAQAAYAAAGDTSRARTAAAGAAVLLAVLDAETRPAGASGDVPAGAAGDG